MTIRVELVSQIRFALHELRARNGHHEFEAICRELARLRFTPNILPATGPVGAGGDQGRDFETFQTAVRSRIGQTSLLLGLRGNELIAFACTLQQADIAAKIQTDVDTICGSGERVELIVAFCEADLPVGSRHALQTAARNSRHARLEVFDGVAIADQLAESDAFWIVRQYLALPAALFPDEPDATPTEYELSRQTWRDRMEPPRALADLVSLRTGLRYAMFEEGGAADVAFWLERIRLLAIDQGSPSLRQLARYEVVFGALRGLGTLRGEEELFRAHLEEAAVSDEPAMISDATILLLAAGGAWVRCLTDIQSTELMSWNGRLSARVAALLETEPPPSRRASLLDTMGTLRLQPNWLLATPSSTPMPFDVREIRGIADAGELDEPTSVPSVDPVGGVFSWLEAARLLSEVPTYPVDSLAKRVALLAPLISSVAGYRELTGLLDDRVAEVAGGSAAAERCRDRALAQHRAGNILEALQEFHQARVSWFTGDTLRGSLLAQIFVAKCYLELELPTAAKFTWLTCAYVAGSSDELADLIPPCLFAAASCDFAVGAWFGANELLKLACRAQAMFSEDPWDTSRHEQLTHGLFEWSVIEAIAARLGEPNESLIRGTISRVGASQIIDPAVSLGAWWSDLTTDEFADRVSIELGHPAFADAGEVRVLRWRALGIEWRLRFSNDYETTVAAERLAAAMQIVCADLAETELYLLKTTIDAEVVLGTAAEAEPVPSNAGRCWRLRVPAPQERSRGEREVVITGAIGIVLTLLYEASLAPVEDIQAATEASFKRGLMDRFSPGLLYDDVFPISRAEFDHSLRGAGLSRVTAEHPRAEHAELRWRDTISPGYDAVKGEADAARRYEKLASLLPFTIPQLLAQPEFQQLIAALRADGWKDWHILQAATSIVWTYRMEVRGHTRDPRVSQREGRRIAQEPELPGDPVPAIGAFTVESMVWSLRFSMLATLVGWGLQLRQETPDFPAIEEILAVRYRYWEDDAPHTALPV
jgi:hypothetical protein